MVQINLIKNFVFLICKIKKNWSSKNQKFKLIKDIKDDLIIDLFGCNLTLTSAYMKKSNLFVGNDSGLMHLAVANKLRVISLFGPTVFIRPPGIGLPTMAGTVTPRFFSTILILTAWWNR